MSVTVVIGRREIRGADVSWTANMAEAKPEVKGGRHGSGDPRSSGGGEMRAKGQENTKQVKDSKERQFQSSSK